MADSKLKVEVQAVADQFQAQMQASAESVKQLSLALKQMGPQALPDFSPAVKSSNSFLSTLKEEKAEMRLQTGLVRMFAGEMQGLGINVGTAGQSVLNFGANLATGAGVFGLTLAAAQAVVSVVKSFTEESEKAKKAAEEFAKAVSEELNVALNDLAIAQMKNQGFTEGQIEQWKQGNKQATEHAKLVKALGEAQANLRAYNPATSFAGPGELERLQKAVDLAKENLEVQKKQQALARGAKAQEISVEADTKAQKEAEKATEEEEKKRQANAKQSIEKRKAEEEKYAAWEVANTEGVSQTITELVNEQANEFAAAQKKKQEEETKTNLALLDEAQTQALAIADIEIDSAEESAAKRAQIEQDFLTQKLALVQDNEEQIRTIKNRMLVLDAQKNKAATNAAKANLESAAATGKAIGSVIGSAFADLADGTKTAGEAIKSIFVGTMDLVLDKVLEVATTQIIAAALGTGAENAKAVGGIPIIGPALSVGAMAAGVALVKGLLAQLPSAATGWQDIPRDMLIQAHAGETIVPRYDSEEVRGKLGGNAGNVTINVSATDAKSFAQQLRDNSSELARALRTYERSRKA
jgi:chemotaxis protein histidine kinase CheA